MSVRLALFYAAVFCIIGVQLPFWPVWLAAQGLTPQEIGVLLATTSLTRIVASPTLAPVADRTGRRKPIIVVLAGLSLAATALFSVAHGFWMLFAVTVLAACFFTPLLPMTESHAVVAVRDHGVDYGRVRAVGSIAFIVTATLGGWLLADLGAPILLWLSLGMLALAFAASAGLPDLRTKPATRLHASLGLLLQRRFLVFMLATMLIQSSHVVYYGFASIHWRSVGISDSLIGALWSEGVIAEIVLFALSARVRLAPRTLLLIGAAGALVRWAVLGTTDAIWALALVQTLHALTFGCTHLAAIRFIMREVPPEAGSTAQSLYFSLAGGGAAAIAMAAAGVLYADWGTGAYYAMAGVAVVGGLVALFAGVSRSSRSAAPQQSP